MPTGADARVRPHTACERSPIATVPGLWRRLSGVPGLRVCTRAKEIGRSLAIGPHDAALRRHRAWMATSAAKQALRKQLVEPVSESSRSSRGHGGSCCAASPAWRPSGPCWPLPSTCALCGGPGAPAPSSSYPTGRISAQLPDPNCASNHPSLTHRHLRLSRQESFSKSHRLKPTAPTCYPLHHFWDRLTTENFSCHFSHEMFTNLCFNNAPLELNETDLLSPLTGL